MGPCPEDEEGHCVPDMKVKGVTDELGEGLESELEAVELPKR